MNYIYALCDPRDNQIRYIGITKHPNERLHQHINDRRNRTHKDRWISALLEYNLHPIMIIIESIENHAECESREQFWIKHYRDLGYDLTNISDGGELCDGKKSEQGIANIIAALVKRNKSPKMRERSRQTGLSRKGSKHTTETKEKIRASMTGKKIHSDEFKRALAERNRTRKYDSEKMREGARKLWDNPIKSPSLRKRVSELGKRWRGIPKPHPISSEQARINAHKLWDDPIKGALMRAKLVERNKKRHPKANPR